MAQKILVAYATTHGATKEIAAAVAESLREGGLAVDLQPARAVRALDGVAAVVLGAPLYMFRLHNHARAFLSRHRQALSTLPVALFAGGPFGKGTEEEWAEVRKEVDRELAKFPWFHPVDTHLVGGRFDPSKLRFPWNLIPAMRNMPPGDLRDWDDIRAWAVSLRDLHLTDTVI